MSDKTFRVRITGCSQPTWWYNKLIGQVFDVSDVGSFDDYHCDSENAWIAKSDCELVTDAEPKELIKLPVRVDNDLFIADANGWLIAPLEDGYIKGTFIKAQGYCSLLNQPQRAIISEDRVKELKQKVCNDLVPLQGGMSEQDMAVRMNVQMALNTFYILLTGNG